MSVYKLNANETSTINVVGRYFRVFSAVTELTVRISGQGKEYYNGKISSGVGIEFTDINQFPAPFDSIQVTSAQAQTVDLWHELAKADDDRLSGNFDINAALTVAQTAPSKVAAYRVVLNGGATYTLMAENKLRKRALIQVRSQSGTLNADSHDGIWIYPSDAQAWEGINLEIGDSMEVETTAQLRCAQKNNSDNGAIINVMEFAE